MEHEHSVAAYLRRLPDAQLSLIFRQALEDPTRWTPEYVQLIVNEYILRRCANPNCDSPPPENIKP